LGGRAAPAVISLQLKFFVIGWPYLFFTAKGAKSAKKEKTVFFAVFWRSKK